MVRRSAKVLVFEAIGALLLLALAAAAFLAFRLANGPVELAVFRADIERTLSEARGGRAVTLDEVVLEWSTDDRRVLVTASNLAFFDETGQIAARAEVANITFDASSLVFGTVEVLQLHLSKGWMTVQRRSPTLWTVAGEPLPEFRARQLPETPEGWITLANQTLSDVLAGLERREADASLEAISFDAFNLNIVDEAGDALGGLANATGGIKRGDDGLFVSVAGAGDGEGLPDEVSLEVLVDPRFNEISASFGAGGWPFSTFAQRFGLGAERLSRLETDLSLDFAVRRDGGLQTIGIKADIGAGRIGFGPRPVELSGAEFTGAYSPASDYLTIEEVSLNSDLVSGRFRGRISDALAMDEDRDLEITGSNTRVDFTPVFPVAWDFDAVSLRGELSSDWRRLDLDVAEVDYRSGKLSARGDIAYRPDAAGDVPLEAGLTAEFEGDWPVETVLDFWPERLGEGARLFVIENISNARLDRAEASLDLKPDSFDQGFLRDEDLDVRFQVSGAEVRFLDDVPPVSNVTAEGRLSGNSFEAELISGNYSTWAISEGKVEFPKLNPKGEDFIITGSGSGPAADILRILSESRLQLGAESGFDPDRFSGDVTADIRLTRPALSEVEPGALKIDVTGTVNDGGLRDVVAGMDLTGARIDIDFNMDRLILRGDGDLGPAPVQFTWRDAFGEDTGPADLSATGFITPDLLNSFGIIGRAYLAGSIPVEAQAKIGSAPLESAQFAFDLQTARIDVPEFGWLKPAGDVARAILLYEPMEDGGHKMVLRLASDDAEVDADIFFRQAGGIDNIALRRLFVSDRAEISGSLVRRDDGEVVIDIEGPFLDLSPALTDFGSLGDDADGLRIPFTAQGDVDRLKLRGGLELSGATLNLITDREELRQFDASGEIGPDAGFELSFAGGFNDADSRLSVSSDNAGFVLKALSGEDFISGGALDLEGILAEEGPAEFDIRITGGRLRDAPLLTQILSLASLRGLADTLGGDGVLFSEIEIPLTIGGGRYVIDGARANGPALGMTANGWLAQEGGELSFNGVLVPSFGMNSMLGGVPVIGDLFVGREGEGIFSLTYSIRGTLQKAQVGVNPLSAVTPGILRRIFENPSDTSIPDSLPVDPDITPPAPPLPDGSETIESAPGAG